MVKKLVSPVSLWRRVGVGVHRACLSHKRIAVAKRLFFEENKQMCHKLMAIIDDKTHVLGIHGLFFKICCNGSETTTKIYIIILF